MVSACFSTYQSYLFGWFSFTLLLLLHFSFLSFVSIIISFLLFFFFWLVVPYIHPFNQYRFYRVVVSIILTCCFIFSSATERKRFSSFERNGSWVYCFFLFSSDWLYDFVLFCNFVYVNKFFPRRHCLSIDLVSSQTVRLVYLHRFRLVSLLDLVSVCAYVHRKKWTREQTHHKLMHTHFIEQNKLSSVFLFSAVLSVERNAWFLLLLINVWCHPK